MKRYLALILLAAILIGCMPVSAFAAAKQMNDGVPVWSEETVRQYALDYVEGKSMDRLWGYYDLQIRRYLPQTAFEAFLLDLEFLTGSFESLGSNAVTQLHTDNIHISMHTCVGTTATGNRNSTT